MNHYADHTTADAVSPVHTHADGGAESIPSKDAAVQVTVRADKLLAEATATAPEGEGAKISREMIDEALKKAGVVFGMQEEAYTRLLHPLYGRPVVIAKATPAVDGADGVCTELYARTRELKFAERADGSVDYKELGTILDVPAGTVVCEVTQPTQGTDGMNVIGQPLKARAGKRASVPIGEGTRISADGLRVETIVAGNLVFRAGKFCVDQVFRAENIDLDTGNITFSGDVIVNGDVLDGFEIHSGGNVHLRGRVGSAQIVAAGNITLDNGINGTGRALLDAGKTLKADFIENCNVRAGEKVVASSLINSQVECEGDVIVTNGKGVICGGKVTAFGSVKANEIGNEFNTLTIVVMGITPRLLKERKRLNDQLKDVTAHVDEMLKNIAYIERLVADNRPIPPERVQILQRTKIQMPLSERKQEKLRRDIADLDEKMSSVNTSTLMARIIHPPTKISIGSLSTNCIETRNLCRVYRSSEGELVLGSY